MHQSGLYGSKIHGQFTITYVESDIIEAIEMLPSEEVSSGVCDL